MTLTSTANILIVEDDAVLQDAYGLVVERAGYGVLHASTGAEALAFLAQHDVQVALVVLDLTLPDGRGLDILDAIRRGHDDRSLPVIIVTGADELEDRLSGFRRGASDYLIKPVALCELVERVETHVRTASHWRAQVETVIATRRSFTADLAVLGDVTDTSDVSSVVTFAASNIPDVTGAAFVVDVEESLMILAVTGLENFSPGAVLPAQHVRRGTHASGQEVVVRGDLGLDGVGRVALTPFRTAQRSAGYLLVVFDADLPDDRIAALTSAVADLCFLAGTMSSAKYEAERALEQRHEHHLRTVLDRSFHIVFQPIIDLRTGLTAGYEALTRFDDGSRPDVVFADAHEVGMGVEVERATAIDALRASKPLPAHCYVSINVSARAALDVGFLEALVDGHRSVLIELTEHDAVEDYDELIAVLDTVRDRADIAIDDAGSGYSGLAHIRALRPDVIKLDRSLVCGVDDDEIGAAMVAGLVHFADEIGCRVVGEGVETQGELAALCRFGVSHGQGFLLGRPAPAGSI